ncbi:hypothetical protein EDC04DRAFT_2610209 [Pisolithus marmoratus]|nr:hypothetical protein EDC04DRAFT_2610209 [Pisolithus marmoratus]
MFTLLIALLGKLVCRLCWSPPPPPSLATMSQFVEHVTETVEWGTPRPQPAARDILGDFLRWPSPPPPPWPPKHSLATTHPSTPLGHPISLLTASWAPEAPQPTTPPLAPNFSFPLDGWTPPPKPSFVGTGVLHQPISPTPTHHSNLIQGSPPVKCSNWPLQDTMMMSLVPPPYHPPQASILPSLSATNSPKSQDSGQLPSSGHGSESKMSIVVDMHGLDLEPDSPSGPAQKITKKLQTLDNDRFATPWAELMGARAVAYKLVEGMQEWHLLVEQRAMYVEMRDRLRLAVGEQPVDQVQLISLDRELL